MATLAHASLVEMAAIDQRGRCTHHLVDHPARRQMIAAGRAWTEAKLNERLGYVPRIEMTGTPMVGIVRVDVAAFDRSGRRIATQEAYLLSPYHLNIADVTVDENLRNKGVADLMFASLLTEAPDVLRIGTVLTQTNAQIIRAAVADGVPCAEAIRKSPAGQTRARFGFTILIGEPKCGPNDQIRYQTER